MGRAGLRTHHCQLHPAPSAWCQQWWWQGQSQRPAESWGPPALHEAERQNRQRTRHLPNSSALVTGAGSVLGQRAVGARLHAHPWPAAPFTTTRAPRGLETQQSKHKTSLCYRRAVIYFIRPTCWSLATAAEPPQLLTQATGQAWAPAAPPAAPAQDPGAETLQASLAVEPEGRQARTQLDCWQLALVFRAACGELPLQRSCPDPQARHPSAETVQRQAGLPVCQVQTITRDQNHSRTTQVLLLLLHPPLSTIPGPSHWKMTLSSKTPVSGTRAQCLVAAQRSSRAAWGSLGPGIWLLLHTQFRTSLHRSCDSPATAMLCRQRNTCASAENFNWIFSVDYQLWISSYILEKLTYLLPSRANTAAREACVNAGTELTSFSILKEK